MQHWRSSFQVWARICLDLANHPPERVMTHWYLWTPFKPATRTKLIIYIVCNLSFSLATSKMTPPSNISLVGDVACLFTADHPVYRL